MNNTINITDSNKKKIFPFIYEFFLLVLIIYTFYIQYVIIVVPNIIVILSVLLFVMSMIAYGKIPIINRNSSMYIWILAFVIISVITSMLSSVSFNTSMDLGMKMIEYSLTGLSFYVYIKKYTHRLFRLLNYIFISILMLAISAVLNREIIDITSAIDIENLNANVMSSFFMIFTYCFFMLLNSRGKFYNLFLVFSEIIVFFAQLLSASRRGFLVLCFMILFCIIFGLIRSKKSQRKRILFFVGFSIILFLIIIFTWSYLLNNTLLGKRLSGEFNGGDILRKRYQSFAFEQFKKHPLTGIGIGGVGSMIGMYSHSLYYETMACTGLLGFGILLLSFFKYICGIASKCKMNINKKSMYYETISLIFFMSMIISGYAVVMIYDFYFYWSFGILASISKIWLKCNDNICNI